MSWILPQWADKTWIHPRKQFTFWLLQTLIVKNFKINTDLEELGLCRVEYLPFPKGTEYIRDPSKPGNRYAKKTIVASVYPNSGSIYGLKLYFAPKVNGAWDNNSDARRVITLKGTDGARDDFISDNMERVQTQWKEYSQSMRMSVALFHIKYE